LLFSPTNPLPCATIFVLFHFPPGRVRCKKLPDLLWGLSRNFCLLDFLVLFSDQSSYQVVGVLFSIDMLFRFFCNLPAETPTSAGDMRVSLIYPYPSISHPCPMFPFFIPPFGLFILDSQGLSGPPPKCSGCTPSAQLPLSFPPPQPPPRSDPLTMVFTEQSGPNSDSRWFLFCE